MALPLSSRIAVTARSRLGVRLFSAQKQQAHDPHRILGVSCFASSDEIRQAYLQRAKELHPDTNTAPDAQQQFQRLQAAYAAVRRSGSVASAGSASASTAGGGAYASAAGARQSTRTEGWDFSGGNPMGSGMNYDEWRSFHAQRSQDFQQTAWQQPSGQPVSAWTILTSRRGWVRYGLVHRIAHRTAYRLIALWPVWLAVFAVVTMMRARRPVQLPPDFVQYDNFGRAWHTDMHGRTWRVAQYDIRE